MSGMLQRPTVLQNVHKSGYEVSYSHFYGPQHSVLQQGLDSSSVMEQGWARAAKLPASFWTTLRVADGATSG